MLSPELANAAVFDFSFAPNGSDLSVPISGTGTFTTTGSGPYTITGIDGTVTDDGVASAISGLTSPAGTFTVPDQTLYFPEALPGQGFFSFNGVSFDAGGTNYILKWDDFVGYQIYSGAGPFGLIAVSVTEHVPTAVPSPIAGAGIPAFAALGGFAIWRRRRLRLAA
jgi:hypothetical protein